MDNQNKKPELLYQIIYDATRDKFGILPILSGLILALITFGVSSGLFPLNDSIRYLVTILLFLMILSIQIYYSETIELLVEATKKFDSHFGKIDTDTSVTVAQSFWFLITGRIRGELKEKIFFKRFSSQFPAMTILLLWFVVFLLIIQIWK